MRACAPFSDGVRVRKSLLLMSDAPCGSSRGWGLTHYDAEKVYKLSQYFRLERFTVECFALWPPYSLSSGPRKRNWVSGPFLYCPIRTLRSKFDFLRKSFIRIVLFFSIIVTGFIIKIYFYSCALRGYNCI